MAYSVPVRPCRDQSVRLWDWKAGKVLAVFAHENEAFAAEFVGNDRFVVSVGHDSVARVWVAATGRPSPRPSNLGGGD